MNWELACFQNGQPWKNDNHVHPSTSLLHLQTLWLSDPIGQWQNGLSWSSSKCAGLLCQHRWSCSVKCHYHNIKQMFKVRHWVNKQCWCRFIKCVSGYSCEPHNNPADFFLDVINGDFTATTSTKGHNSEGNCWPSVHLLSNLQDDEKQLVCCTTEISKMVALFI